MSAGRGGVASAGGTDNDDKIIAIGDSTIDVSINSGKTIKSRCASNDGYGDSNVNSSNDSMGESFPDCWSLHPSFKLERSWYFSVRGAESMHMYLWLLTDLCWVQSWYYLGHICGLFSILWCACILSRAIRLKNWKEVFISSSMLLWLNGNYVWMNGELHDNQYPNEPPLYHIKTIQCRWVMEIAIALLLSYYLVLKPANVLFVSSDSESIYNDSGLKCRFSSLVPSWRHYENILSIFWLTKDYTWNRLNPHLWCCLIIPTLVVSFDMFLSTLGKPSYLLENVHYCSQFFWVLANVTWAFGEIFYPQNDLPLSMFSFNSDSFHTFRWYSSWLLVIALIPIIFMYAVWLFAMATKKLEPIESFNRHPYSIISSLEQPPIDIEPPTLSSSTTTTTTTTTTLELGNIGATCSDSTVSSSIGNNSSYSNNNISYSSNSNNNSNSNNSSNNSSNNNKNINSDKSKCNNNNGVVKPTTGSKYGSIL